MNARKMLAIAAVLAAGTLLAGNATAQEQETLRLSGSKGTVLNLRVTPTRAATTLDLDAPTADLKVADVYYRANVAGFSLTFESANSGALVHSAGDRVGYTLGFEGQSMNLSEQFVKNYSTRTAVSGVTSDLSISYDDIWAAPGAYTDIVTVTLAATS